LHNKRKIAICHPRMGRGGSEAAVMWGIEALKNDFAVSVVTSCPIDLEGLNKFYGTAVAHSDISVRIASMPGIISNANGAAALRGAFYQRYCRKVAHEFDAVISAYNPCDFGVPAIHLIADFSWDEDIRRKYDSVKPGMRQIMLRPGFIRQCYLALSRMVSNSSGRNLFDGKDLLLANSKWTAAIMAQKYGVEGEILYPPVYEEFPEIEIADKQTGFVCIGRISPEKRIDRIIDILKIVRTDGYDIHLHIIGKLDGSEYANMIEKICCGEKDWIILDGECFGEKKRRLLAGHQYGIHGRESEPFGIAVAEMVKAGCLTFAPAEGGQAEIVGHEALLYKNIDDAAEKITKALKNADLANELRLHLVSQARNFSVNRFKEELIRYVNRFLTEKNDKMLENIRR
jgi:glycosyltransferase involved in cell wall biosynthesis